MNDFFRDCFIEAMDVDVPESVWSRFGVDPDSLTQLQLPGVVVGDCSRWMDRWHPLPRAEPHGAIATAGNRFGIRHILQVGDDGKPIVRVASFPRMAEGRQYTVEIKRVELAPDRLQLRVIGDIIIKVGAGERRHHIAFYDAAGPINRGFYRRGARHDFVLTGITLNLRKERQVAGRERNPFMTTRALQFGGRSDTYFARIEVTHIEALHEPILGHPAWRVRGIISDDTESPLEVETLTTALSLDGAEPPAVGEIARADFWLIGELWHLGPQAIVLPERIPTFDETVRDADDVEPPPLWWLFGDADDDEYLEELKYHVVVASWPLVFSDGSPLIGVSFPLPEGEPAFEVRLGRGSAGCGVRTIFVPNLADRTMEAVSLHPIAISKNDHLVTVQHVDVSSDRLHGRIVGDWMAADSEDAMTVPIAFYDLYWHQTRQITRAGDVCRYALSIIADNVVLAEDHKMTMPTPAWMRELATSGQPDFAGYADRETIDLNFGELRTLLDMTDRDGRSDEYRFRGLVHKVGKLRDGVILEDAWELMVEVLEVDGEPFVIKVLATERALHGKKPPRKGKYVEGSGWMQGALVELVRRKSVGFTLKA
jgi:hypothetical protein